MFQTVEQPFFKQCHTSKYLELFAEGEVHVGKYLLSLRRGKYSLICTEPKANDCFSMIFTCEHQKEQNNDLELNKEHTENMTQLSGHILKCYIHRVAWSI